MSFLTRNNLNKIFTKKEEYFDFDM